MTTDPTSPSSGADDGTDARQAAESEGGPAATAVPSAAPGRARFTRAGAAWTATGVALLLLILLIIFIAQNTTKAEIHFLGLNGSISLGLALLIAAVAGGVLVAITGVTRVTQLRLFARRARRGKSGPDIGRDS